MQKDRFFKWFTRIIFISLLTITAFQMAGCVKITPPKGYFEVDHSYLFRYKAVSAQGNVIALSKQWNDDKTADLVYWSEAIEYQKVDIEGYNLIERESIRSEEEDLTGTLLTFEVGEKADKILYLVGIYVDRRSIWVIEAGGPVDSIKEEKAEIVKSMESLD